MKEEYAPLGVEEDFEEEGVIEEKPKTVEHHNFCVNCILGFMSKTTVRRLVRIIYLLVILFAVMALPLIYIYQLISPESEEISANTRVSLDLQKCKLYFREDSDINAGEVKIYISTPGSHSIRTSGGTTSVVAHNTGSLVDACWVGISLREGTQITGGIGIECDGECWVIHEGPPTLDLGSGTFTYSGGKTNLNLMGVRADNMQMGVGSGVISIHNAVLGNSVVSAITNVEGDVIFQSTGDFEVDYYMDSSQICTAAPFISTVHAVTTGCTHINTTASDSQTYSGDSDGASSCEGSYLLSNASDAVNPFTLKVTAKTGNIYANVIPAAGVGVQGDDRVLKGEYYRGGIKFEPRYKHNILEERKYYNNTAKTDSFMLFNLGNFHGRAESSTRMVTSTNYGYLNTKPWWISLFSAKLLVGGLYDMTGILKPGFCPYYQTLSQQNVGAISELIINTLAQNTISSSDTTALSYAEGLPLHEKDAHKNSYGTRQSKTELELLEPILNDKGEYRLVLNDWSNSSPLLSAILISLVLAVIIGLLSMVGVAIGMQILFDFFTDESKHIRKYTKLNPNMASIENEEVGHARVFPEDEVPDMERDHPSVAALMAMPPKERGKLLMKKKKTGLLSLIFGRLPSQFTIIDHGVFLLKRYFAHSIREFYDDALISGIHYEDLEDNMQDIPLSKLKERYEQYCFVKNLEESNMLDEISVNFLQSRGFSMEKRSDAFTEVFKKIRFLNDKEEISSGRKERNKDQSSLKDYVTNRCVLTQFEEDQITCDLFKERYVEYCHRHRLQVMPVDRMVMSENFGIEAQKKEMTVIFRTETSLATAPKNKHYYKIDLDKCDQKLSEEMALHTDNPLVYKKKKGNPWSRGWVIFDLVAALFHVGAVVLLMLPPICIPCFMILERGMYTTADYNDEFRYQDLTDTQWNIPNKITLLDWRFQFFWGFAYVYGWLSFVDLFFYYLTLSFPLNTLSSFSRKGNKRNSKIKKNRVISFISKTVLFFEWICIFIVLGCTLGYLFLVCIWSILGAVLNPNAYLVYAASASTFMAFISLKITQFRNLKQVGLECIQRLVMEKMQGFMDGVMKKMAIGMGVKEDMIQSAIDVAHDPQSLEKQVTGYLANTPLAKKILGADMDLGLMVRVAKGDQDAIIELGRKKGIPKEIMISLVAVLMDDHQLLEEGLTALCSHPTINLPPDMTKVLIEIFFNRDASTENIVNLLSIAVFNTIQKNLGKENKNMELIKPIFPMIINAILELNKGSLDSFSDHLKKMNMSLIESVAKKIAFEESFGKGDTKLFTETGEPTFAIPSYLIQAIELIKIPLGSKNDIIISTDRLHPALFDILESVLGIDRCILDFIAMVFSANKERLYGSSSTKKLMMKEQKNQLIEKMAGKIKIHPAIIRIFMKVAFDEKMVDRELVTDLSNLLALTPYFKKHTIDPEMLKTGLNLIGILKSKSMTQELVGMSAKFGIDPKDARTLVNISSNYEFSKESLQALSGTTIIRQMAKILRISNKEVMGLICLIIGDLSNDYIELILKSVCKRCKIPVYYVAVIKSLLVLFMGKETEQIMHATDTLKIKDYIWILLGKKLLSPRFIDEDAFLELGIPYDNNIITKRRLIDCQNVSPFNKYLKNFADTLGKTDDESIIFQGDEGEPISRSPTKPVGSTTMKSEKSIYGGGSSYLQFESNKKFQVLITRRRLVARLLRIGDQPLNSQLVNQLLHNYYRYQLELGKKANFDSKQIDSIIAFLHVKDIILGKGANQINTATQKLAEIMGFEERILLIIVQIIMSKNPLVVRKAIKKLFIEAIHEKVTFSEFGRVVSEEMEGVKGMEEAVQYIGKALNVPVFILNKLMAPFLGKTYQLTMDDIAQLMFMAGINDENMQERGIVIKDVKGKVIPTDKMVLLLAGLAVGHIRDFKQTLQLFNIPVELSHLIQSITTNRPRIAIEILIAYIRPMVINQLKIPPHIFDIFLALIIYFKGFSDDFSFIYKKERLKTMNYLGKQFGILPEFLQGIEAVITYNKEELADILQNLAKRGELLGRHIIEPYLVKGIIAIVSGEPHNTEDIAEALSIDHDLLDVCLLFSNFAKKRGKGVSHTLRQLKTLPQFSRFCLSIKMDPEIVRGIIELAFNKVNYERLTKVFNMLKLNELCDIQFVHALMSIAKGYNAIKDFDENEYSKNSQLRYEIAGGIAKYASPLFKKMNMDADLALIAIRIQQGDFYIIDDKKDYLQPFLPTQEIRDMCMGLCGMSTCPIKYKNRIGNYPKKFGHNLTFEGATELLAEVLGINPLVSRLVTFDPETYAYIEKEYNFPSVALKALIISFASMPNNMITFYIFREMFKAGDDLKRKLTILKQKLVDQTATGIKSKVTVTEQNPLTGSPKKKKKKDPNAINIVGGTTPEDDMKVEEELKLAEEEDDAYAKDSEDDWEEHLHTDHTGTSKIDISIISAMHEDGEATDNNQIEEMGRPNINFS